MSGLASTKPNDAFEALPEALSELISRVIRGTRLWPSEKRDVRAELESHFREGLIELTQEGLTVAESVEVLRDGFGDPETAAILIRRGKKRGRSMLWKITISAAMVLFSVVGAGAGYFAYVQFGQPNPTVDYVAQINEPVRQTPEADRAWPLYHEIIQAMDLMPALADARQSMPRATDAGWQEVLPWLTANQRLVSRILDAAQKPVFGYVYGHDSAREYLVRRALAVGEAGTPEEAAARFDQEGDPLMPPTVSLLLPHLTDMRDLGRLLVLSAREHLSHGDFEEAWGELDACHRMGVQLLGGQTLIEQLVGVSIARMATEEMRRTLSEQHAVLNPEQIKVLSGSHVLVVAPETYRANLAGERFFFHDCVQYLFTDDGAGSGRLIPSQYDKLRWMGQSASPTQSDSALGAIGKDAELLAIATAHADRRETLEKHQEIWERMNELLALPLYDSRRAEADRMIERETGGSKGRRFALIALLHPSLTTADRTFREAAMEHAATQAVIAMVQYRAAHAAWPERLDDLSPEYLRQVPVDAYTGMYLKYGLTEAGVPRLYSVGRDMQDDGGSTEPVESGGGRPQTRDIVYWPTSN